MPQIIYSNNFNTDFQRMTDFMMKVSPETVGKMTLEILNSLDILNEQPEIGSPSHYKELEEEFSNLRKFTISFGKSSYIVLYNYDKAKDIVVLAYMKHSKEQSFSFENNQLNN